MKCARYLPHSDPGFQITRTNLKEFHIFISQLAANHSQAVILQRLSMYASERIGSVPQS